MCYTEGNGSEKKSWQYHLLTLALTSHVGNADLSEGNLLADTGSHHRYCSTEGRNTESAMSCDNGIYDSKEYEPIDQYGRC